MESDNSNDLIALQPILDRITEYSSLYMKISDIAYLLDMTPDKLRRLMEDHSLPYYAAYMKGKMLTKLALHEQEKKLALVGSPLAVENMKNNLLDMEDDE